MEPGTIQPRIIQPRIIHGDEVKIEHFPHSVCLLRDDHATCGGSVLTQWILLTAAHCILPSLSDVPIDVYAGHEDLRRVKIIIKVQSKAMHSGFNPYNYANDIGLVLLQSPLKLGHHTKRVIIKPKNDYKGVVVVAGWGKSEEDSWTRSQKLRYTFQKLRIREYCSNMAHTAVMPLGVLCCESLPPVDGKPHDGDSGSALMNNGEQIGIVSYFVKVAPRLEFYTNVSYFYSWIHKAARKMYCGESKNRSPSRTKRK